MISFWNITSDKFNELLTNHKDEQEKIIFVSDTGRIYTEFNGKCVEYRSIIYVQDINQVAEEDDGKDALYFDVTSKSIYFYADGSYHLLNPNPDSISYIGKLSLNNPTIDQLNNFVVRMKGRPSKINDFVIDNQFNQWIKVDNKNDENDWEIIGKVANQNSSETNIGIAGYEKLGLVSIKEGCGLIIGDNGELSLNLLDENREAGQIVILNEEGKIDEDLYDTSSGGDGSIIWKEL